MNNRLRSCKEKTSVKFEKSRVQLFKSDYKGLKKLDLELDQLEQLSLVDYTNQNFIFDSPSKNEYGTKFNITK